QSNHSSDGTFSHQIAATIAAQPPNKRSRNSPQPGAIWNTPILYRPQNSIPALSMDDSEVASANPTCLSGQIRIRFITILATIQMTATRTGVFRSWRAKKPGANTLISMNASTPSEYASSARAD